MRTRVLGLDGLEEVARDAKARVATVVGLGREAHRRSV
jgi:hypothetical protein